MFKRIKFLIIMLISLSWADVPPPPVNQNVGIPDSIFNNLEKLDCAYCHKSDTLTQTELDEIGWTFVAPTVKDGILADRHHVKVGTIIIEDSASPFGTSGESYTCLSCHQLQWDVGSSTYKLSDNFKDCLNCHRQVEGKASVHHLTQYAKELNCKYCHGSRIDNPNDGHYIPSKPVSSFTPRASGGKGPNGEGACTFCHSAGVDEITGVIVEANNNNHHAIGIGQWGVSALQCVTCHAPHGMGGQAIRTCENCHSINSIHNIQADSDGDGIITVGQERPYYGHIGNSSTDCKGCHVGYVQNSLDLPGLGYIVPQLTSMSKFKISAGLDTTITITGQALINNIETKDGTKTLKSIITVTNNNNNKVINLSPRDMSESSLTVTIPSNLDAGNYYIRAKKGENESNPMSLVITPNISINSISINNDIFTINGVGFGHYIDAVDSGTKITLSDLECQTKSWSDKKIVTECSKKCGLLKIDGVFGSVTKNINCDNGDSNYDAGFKQGELDACSYKTWSIPTSYLGNDIYVKGYDDGWESCDRSNPPANDGDYTIGFDKGKADSCSWKTWSIPETYLGNDTYIRGYDNGWESCDRSTPPANDGDYTIGFDKGKADSCSWKTWSIPETYLGNDAYIGGYDDGWESCDR